jgi:hypothetical protein
MPISGPAARLSSSRPSVPNGPGGPPGPPVADRIAADPTLIWLHLAPAELIRRLTGRALARDENKIRDSESFLAGLDFQPPVVPHLALDAAQPTTVLVQSVLDHLGQ